LPSALGIGLVARILDELAELADRHRVSPQIEILGDPHVMLRPLGVEPASDVFLEFWIHGFKQGILLVFGRAHFEVAGADPHHGHADLVLERLLGIRMGLRVAVF
jgi:hypothetical protein